MNSIQIECVLALSSTLNFSKASEIVHMSQPSFSKIIASLEDEIGVVLFSRNKRFVKPTIAGEAFIYEMSQINGMYNRAVTKAQNISKGIEGSIRIGFFGTGLFHTLPRLFKESQAILPNVTLKLKDCTHAYLSENYLVDKHVDLLLLPGFQTKCFQDAEFHHLFSDDMCVAVSKDHPFATKKEVSVTDLRNESFIVMSRMSSLRDYDFVNLMCSQAGFIPKIVYEADILHNIFLMVECNVGISIFASHLQQFASENLVFLPIIEYRDHFEMFALWNKDHNPFVPRLVDLLSSILEQEIDSRYK